MKTLLSALQLTAVLMGPNLFADEIGPSYALFDFEGITTAWDKLDKSAPVATNTFATGITISNFVITTTSGRENAIIDGQTKAKCSEGGFEAHTFTITIPKLGGRTVTLTSLTFDFDTRNYDRDPVTDPMGWTLSLSQGSASTNSHFPLFKAIHNETITLSGMDKIVDTSATFTINNMSGGNNLSTGFFTGFDNVRLNGVVNLAPGTVICLQ